MTIFAGRDSAKLSADDGHSEWGARGSVDAVTAEELVAAGFSRRVHSSNLLRAARTAKVFMVGRRHQARTWRSAFSGCAAFF